MDKIVEITKDNNIAKVLLNSPETSNSVNKELVQALVHNLVPIALDDTVRALVISGKGKTFCAGGDLNRISELPGGAVTGFYKTAGNFHQAIIEIYRMGKQ
mmetsp:Transcript_21723/g.10157  ORF Transcript_21723/g.10157 Transcript_21723/m.10157 type:complete len:101 (-) Transcript_21723:3254-3556(-)